MTHYEQEVIRLQNRMKRIAAAPAPTRLKSNVLVYEVLLEEAKERLEAWRQGKPFCDGTGVGPALTKAMGFTSTGSVEIAFSAREPQKYLEHARDMGLPVESSCDMSMMPFAMMELGDVPIQDLNVAEGDAPCSPMRMRSTYVLNKSNHFSYPIDIGRERDQANFEYVLNQLRGFIEFAEKIPGIKYDEDKLAESQAYAETGRSYLEEMYQMLKHKPTPIDSKDVMRSGPPYLTGVWSAKWLEVMRVRRDEVRERLEKGIAAVPGEQLRVFWTMTNPVFMDVWKVLAKWKIAAFHENYGPMERGVSEKRPAFLRDIKLTPLEKMAAELIFGRYRGWGCPGEWQVDDYISVCRDLQIDAIVNYNMLGCTKILGIKRMIEERAEKELGIPTLQLEGKQWDSNYADEATITAKLDEFAQMLLSKRGLA